MIYIRNEIGKLQSMKDLAQRYNLPLSLIQGRYNRGIRDIKELTQPKYEMLKKGK